MTAIQNSEFSELIARVAQWIEQLPSKEKAEGSIPSAGTTKQNEVRFVAV